MSELFNQQAAAPEPEKQVKAEVHITKRPDGKKIINSDFAGKAMTWQDMIKDKTPEQIQDIKDRCPDFEKRYPEGILFSSNGRPDFTAYAVLRIEVEGMNGEQGHDKRLVADKLGTSKKELGAYIEEICRKEGLPVESYTLHHASANVAEFVPTGLHAVISHYGGRYEIQHGIGITPSLEQVVQDSYTIQKGLEAKEKSLQAAASETTPKQQQPEMQSPAAYTAHIQDGELKTQFSAGDGKGPLGHADFRKDEIGRMVHDPEIKTINGHERERYAYSYDKAEYEALQRCATPEQARLAASERTQQVMARVELAQERAELRVQPYTKDVNTHFNKIGQLRDARVQDLTAQAKRESHAYRGPAPKSHTERQFEARTGAHIFTSYAKLEIYTKQYRYSPKVYQEKKTGLDRGIAEYKQRARQEHERSLSGISREPSIDHSFGPSLGR